PYPTLFRSGLRALAVGGFLRLWWAVARAEIWPPVILPRPTLSGSRPSQPPPKGSADPPCPNTCGPACDASSPAADTAPPEESCSASSSDWSPPCASCWGRSSPSCVPCPHWPTSACSSSGSASTKNPRSGCSSLPPCRPLPWPPLTRSATSRSEEHTSELQSRENLVCRLLLEKNNVFFLATLQLPWLLP